MSDIVKVTGLIIVGGCLIATIAVCPENSSLWGSLTAILAGVLGIPALVSRYDKRHYK